MLYTTTYIGGKQLVTLNATLFGKKAEVLSLHQKCDYVSSVAFI